MPDNPLISQVVLPGSGGTYDIKDAWARNAIESLSGAMHYIGVTTTPLTDGSTTNPIVVDGESVTADAGSVAIYGENEFVFNGTKWQEFGSTGSLKAMAFADTASGTVNVSGSFSNATVSGTVTPNGSISVGTGTANYTPSGTVGTPTISVSSAGATNTVHNPTKKTVLLTATVSGEVLTFTAGDSITTSDLTVKTGDASYQATQPSWTGTAVQLKFTGSSSTVSGSASGSVSSTGSVTVYPDTP